MATSIVAPFWLYAKVVNTFLKDANTTWDSTTAHKLTVPAGERWLLCGGIVNRDVSSTLGISIMDASDDTILSLCVLGASTGTTAYPYNAVTAMHIPYFGILMDAGEYINFSFGTGQDTSGIISLKYYVIPM